MGLVVSRKPIPKRRQGYGRGMTVVTLVLSLIPPALVLVALVTVLSSWLSGGRGIFRVSTEVGIGILVLTFLYVVLYAALTGWYISLIVRAPRDDTHMKVL